jgi:hypothetical protein
LSTIEGRAQARRRFIQHVRNVDERRSTRLDSRMALTWVGIKQLVRLQAVSEQLAANVHDPEGPRRVRESERGLGHVLDEIIEEVDGALREAEPRLADEFQRIVNSERAKRLDFAARSALLTGWLKGAVEAETLEVRLRVGDDRPRKTSVLDALAVG